MLACLLQPCCNDRSSIHSQRCGEVKAADDFMTSQRKKGPWPFPPVVSISYITSRSRVGMLTALLEVGRSTSKWSPPSRMIGRESHVYQDLLTTQTLWLKASIFESYHKLRKSSTVPGAAVHFAERECARCTATAGGRTGSMKRMTTISRLDDHGETN